MDKILAQKHEDLSLIPGTHLKILTWWYEIGIQMLGRQRQADPGLSPDSQTSLIVEAQVPV